MVTKQQFLDVLKVKLGGFVQRDEAVACANVWWDLWASVDSGFPLNLGWSWIHLRERQVERFSECLDQKALEQIKDHRITRDEEYTKAVLSTMLELGLYREKWSFFNRFSYNDDDSPFDIGFVGDTTDEDVVYYETEYAKSAAAVKELGMTVENDMVVNYDNREIAGIYEAKRGRVCDPETGRDGFDPITCMYKTCELVSDDYERTVIVLAEPNEILKQLETLVSPDVMAKAKELAVAKKVKERLDEIEKKKKNNGGNSNDCAEL